MPLIIKVPVVVLNITYMEGGLLRSLNVIYNYILMGKAVIIFYAHENKQNKSIFHGNHIKVTFLLATSVNFWHSILQFIHIPYVLWAEDRDRWRALLNAVINLWAL
jgi:hypothetical protein